MCPGCYHRVRVCHVLSGNHLKFPEEPPLGLPRSVLGHSRHSRHPGVSGFAPGADNRPCAVYEYTPQDVRNRTSTATRTTIIPITHIQRPVPVNQRRGDRVARRRAAAADAVVAGRRRPARPDPSAGARLRHHKRLNIAVAADGGALRAVAAGAAPGEPRSRGGGAMLARRKPASASSSCWICPSSCTVLLRCLQRFVSDRTSTTWVTLTRSPIH